MRKVYESANLLDAHIVRSRLENEGLEILIQGELLTGALGELPVNATPTLWVVQDEDEPKALDLLAGWHCARAAPAAEWRCPACGEVQSESFEVCWSCGAERA